MKFSIIMLMTVSSWTATEAISENITEELCPVKGDPLTNLGDISTKIVQTIADSEDEKVDIIAIATLINSLSKGAAIVKNPEMYKAINGDDTELKVGKLDQTIKSLSDQMTQMQTKLSLVDQYAMSMEMLEEELNQTKQVVKNLEAKLQGGAGMSGESDFFGFLATATTSQNLDNGETLEFTDVTYNYGSAYSPSSSKFTCKVDGVYLVSAHLEEYGSEGFMVDAMVADNAMFRIHAHDDANEHGSSSAAIPVACAKGSMIWLQSVDSGQINGQQKRSVFSVHLVRPMGASSHD